MPLRHRRPTNEAGELGIVASYHRREAAIGCRLRERQCAPGRGATPIWRKHRPSKRELSGR